MKVELSKEKRVYEERIAAYEQQLAQLAVLSTTTTDTCASASASASASAVVE